jgi:threonyl-tRNA synthetase
LGILIEHFAGAMPPWLAPQQVVILNITDKQARYCQKTQEKLAKMGFRAALDLRNEKVGFKIREHTMRKVPYLLIIGDEEVSAGTVTLRTRSGEDLGSMKLAAYAELLQNAVHQKGHFQNEQTK